MDLDVVTVGKTGGTEDTTGVVMWNMILSTVLGGLIGVLRY